MDLLYLQSELDCFHEMLTRHVSSVAHFYQSLLRVGGGGGGGVVQ